MICSTLVLSMEEMGVTRGTLRPLPATECVCHISPGVVSTPLCLWRNHPRPCKIHLYQRPRAPKDPVGATQVLPDEDRLGMKTERRRTAEKARVPQEGRASRWAE